MKLHALAFVACARPAVAGAGKVYSKTDAEGQLDPGHDQGAQARGLQGADAPTTQGRRSSSSSAAAPKGGPLIDTKTYACDGAAGSFYCKAGLTQVPRTAS